MSNRAALKLAKLPGRASCRGRPGDAVGRAVRTMEPAEGYRPPAGDGNG